MLNLKKPEKNPDPVDVVIENLVSEMAGYPGYDEHYGTMVENLKVLCEAKALLPKPNKLSADTAAAVAANLVGIIMIIGHERANVITTKALGFIIRPKS